MVILLNRFPIYGLIIEQISAIIDKHKVGGGSTVREVEIIYQGVKIHFYNRAVHPLEVFLFTTVKGLHPKRCKQWT